MNSTDRPQSSQRETVVLGGGCFWCTEAVFSKLKGIESVTSGYAGGDLANPSYDKVSMGTTGHAEVVQLVFNPNIITFAQLLDIFWNIHDPTTLNQQGADIGTQYRSVIFYTTPSQKQLAEQSKRAVQSQFPSPIVTKIEPLDTFYTAEEYHQKYYDRNSDQPYCDLIISPKVQKVLKKYPDLIK